MSFSSDKVLINNKVNKTNSTNDFELIHSQKNKFRFLTEKNKHWAFKIA